MVKRESLRRYLLVLCAATTLLASEAKALELKVATLAPRGSIWMRYFDKMKAAVLKETGGVVKLRYYPGQVQGDERDVARKMRTGQLHGGAFTAVGLALLDPSTLVLQLPLLFESEAQVDKVREALTPTLEESLAQKGYVLLGWAEIGWVHVFTRERVETLAGLKKQRLWVQSDDPIGKTMMRELGLKPHPLAIPQVYPALNTGMVNAAYNSPLGCLALQWHTKLRYMVAEPLALGVAATVVTKKAFDQIAPERRKAVLHITRRYHQALMKRTRRDNKKAVEALQKNGVKLIKMSAADRRAQKEAAERVAKKMTPRYFSAELLKQARAAAR